MFQLVLEFGTTACDRVGALICTGASFELAGTIGQPDAGAMSGRAIELTGGFWVGEPTSCLGDVNGNRVVDPTDVAILLSEFDTPCS